MVVRGKRGRERTGCNATKSSQAMVENGVLDISLQSASVFPFRSQTLPAA
jgi:hypothetical protein